METSNYLYIAARFLDYVERCRNNCKIETQAFHDNSMEHIFKNYQLERITNYRNNSVIKILI